MSPIRLAGALHSFIRAMHFLFRFTTRVFALACGTALFSASGAEPPTLTANLAGNGTAVHLELRGTTGTNYTIESSIDLKTWTGVTDGAAQNGILGTDISLGAGGPKRFFRGRETGGAAVSLPTAVVVTANTNLSVTTLVTTNGGFATLYAPDGTQFTLTVPPFTLPESQLITATLVTNVGGLPFSGGLLGAVRLEPENLELWGAATLEITIPPRPIAAKSSASLPTVTGRNFASPPIA